jgi:ribosomal protein S18 acetylase RimI-like enzyme
MTFTIRPATPADATAIADLHMRTRRQAYETFFPAGYWSTIVPEEIRAQWQARLEETHMRVAVAVEDRQVVGFVRFGRADDASRGPNLDAETGEIEFMYVAPECWRRGIGSALMRVAEAGLQDQEFVSGILAVYEENGEGRRFYESQGWAFDGTRWTVDRGGPVVQVRYAKRFRDGDPEGDA